jgi:hypothetical protein
MMSRIERIRRAGLIRRAQTAEEHEATAETAASNLPVPVDAPRTIPPLAARAPGEAAFAAHMLGQDGMKRGLRAGPELFETAQSTYVSTEWSGMKDRRARKGRIARTEA